MKRYLVVGVALVALLGCSVAYAATTGHVWSNAKLTRVVKHEQRVNKRQSRQIARLRLRVANLEAFQHCVAGVASSKNPHPRIAAIVACAA